MFKKLLGVLTITVCMTVMAHAYKLTLTGYNETELR